jgi:hypothetical protein
MKAKIIYFIMTVGLFFSSCDEKELNPVNPSTGKPAPVTDIKMESIPGGAIVSYVVPRDNDVLSVKAVYTLTNGKQRESIASFYENHLIVEGFDDLREHEVLLYTISRAQELSDPVSVRILPLESSLSKAAATVNIIGDFGGANFSWKNEDEVLLTIELFAASDNGQLQTAGILTSKLDSSNVSIRGYDPVPRKFAIVFRDNWDNVSDTIYPEGGTVTPLFETTLDKKDWSIFKINGVYLSGDVTFVNWEGRDEYMFDDAVETYGHSYSGSLPASITFDLGKKVRLSRVLFFQRFYNGMYYSWGNPRRVVIYGREEAPVTQTWDEWEELVDYTMIKPSGTNSEYTINTDEDVLAALEGHEASFPKSESVYRYIRFRFVTSWENRPYVHPAEITIYGQEYEE